jgi:GNAT superfamily N-acetyltransferase
VIEPADLRAMQELAQELWRRSPELVDMTMAELAYQGGMARSNTSDTSELRLWRHGSEVAAWGWFFPPATLEWAVHPDFAGRFDDVLDWFEQRADDGVPLKTSARNADADGQRRLAARGFVRDTESPWMRLNFRTLDDLEAPKVPDGYAFRTVADHGDDIAKRVEVHQASWAALGTRVSLDTYPGVMETWPYRSDLDFVLEAGDGTPVAFALGWYDESNRLGEFEPVGTHPDYRRLGLGRAINLFGLHRFREAGATAAIVASRGDDAHAAPRRLYESVGFRELSRQLVFVRG